MNTNAFDHTDTEALRELFIGRKIVAVDLAEETLTLDNGQIVKVDPQKREAEYCDDAEFFLTALDTTDHVITGCEIKKEWHHDGEDGKRELIALHVYTAGILAGKTAIETRGDSGNGYYGSGFMLSVSVI